MSAKPTSDLHWFMPLWKRRWPLLTCALLFQIAESFLFAPLLGLAGHALLGRPVVDSTALVAFILSPRGFFLLFFVAAAALTIRLFEQAGLAVIVLSALQGKTVRAWAALRVTARELPRLGSLGLLVIGCGLLVAVPVLAVAAFFAARLLPTHDINFYLANRTSEFVTATVVIGIVTAAMLALGTWLLVRWRLVLQVCMFDHRSGWAAFRQAAILSRGVWWSLAWRCLAVLGFQLALVSAAAGLGQIATKFVLGATGAARLSLFVSLALLLCLQTMIGALITAIGACVDAGAFTIFYYQRRSALKAEPILESVDSRPTNSMQGRRFTRPLVLTTVVGVFVFELFGVWVMSGVLKQERSVTVTAHRGAHLKAPENTAAAIRDAIALGADYAEIDVQVSKDGVLIVTHDSDFSRMAGVAKKVWNLNYDEIRAIPLGAHSAPEFRNEPTPTFDEVLSIARDHIKLNVELKYYGDHQPRLAERVVEEVRAHEMTNQVIIQCLEYEPLRTVRRVAPEIPIGYLLSVNAQRPSRLDVNFLGAALSRATGSFVRAAHRRGQEVYVWTVNTPDAMERMIDVGVDSLITDKPVEALRLVRQYERLSPAERTLREARAWLAN
jgi:glycerophosphoryl diester phosphodiesterase